MCWHTCACSRVLCPLPLQVFSQLGGLQLDRDIRSLVAAAGELTTKPVRDKFARLTQVGGCACDPRVNTAVRGRTLRVAHTRLILWRAGCRHKELLGLQVHSVRLLHAGSELPGRLRVPAAGAVRALPFRGVCCDALQMAIVLSLESVEEFLDYWGDDTGHITWRLTPSEVKAILGQRADFNKGTISALPL